MLRSRSNGTAEATSRAVEMAEKALVAAREAQRTATPVLRTAAQTSAETLSRAAGKTAIVLSDTADKLAKSDAGSNARTKLADATEKFAKNVRPAKKRHHRVRKFFLASAFFAGIYYLLAKTPLRQKLEEMAFGPSFEEEEETEPITLPVNEKPAPSTSPSTEGNGTAVSATGKKAESRSSSTESSGTS